MRGCLRGCLREHLRCMSSLKVETGQGRITLLELHLFITSHCQNRSVTVTPLKGRKITPGYSNSANELWQHERGVK